MKIEKKDFMLLFVCALGGFALVWCAIPDPLTAIVMGIPSGVLGGCVACIFRHFMKSKRKQNQKVDHISKGSNTSL